MFESFLNAVRNLFKVSELRKRVLFTLMMLVVYRTGIHIPVPGVDREALAQLWGQLGGMFGVLDLFSGGNLRRISIFALGIMPYITASIILQLMTSIDFMGLKKVQEEGEVGRRKITQYTRYLTVILCLVQGIGISFWLQRQASSGGPLVPGSGIGFIFISTLTLMTGTMFIMWIGEQITERGVGNGISLLIFAGIVVNVPNGVQQLLARVTDPLSAIGVIALVVVMILAIAGIVFVERATRKVPTNHTRRMVGRQMVATAASHLPLKVNIAGVIPVIFASSVLAIPQTLLTFGNWGWLQTVNRWLGGGHPVYETLFIALIVIFAFFYVSIVFNADEVAENLRKQGAFIPGIRPGKRTGDYLNSILVRLTTVGAIYLVVVCLIPQFIISGFKVQYLPIVGPWFDAVLPEWVMTGLGYTFYFGGTSLLIVVGVAMDTISQVEAQLVMRHYDGFLGPRGGRLRGRRTA
ncbi:MAG TPA: preprotein translocase subunit SecY [Blastocatellia bacterium]|jgi:preprotein translocase subunit SecY|nr:preprotein translocase subunit SecY [Blastocatellia bacterium]